MRNLIRSLSVLLVVLLLCGCGKKEPAPVVATTPTVAPETVIAIVNGEEIHQSEYEAYRQQYLTNYTLMGADPTDADTMAYIEDAALTACIEELLIYQDMVAQGCFVFDEETEKWMEEAGKMAYQKALADAGEYLRETLGESKDTDMTQAALAYAEGLGVTEQDYIKVFRDQLAIAQYNTWLIGDESITDEAIQAYYDARVAESKAKYEDNIKAFEYAIANNEEVWYQPTGYRAICQILLPAKGESEAEKLASVQEIVDTIYSRLAAGEAFDALILEYSADKNTNPYSIHRDSIVWDEAFIAAAFSEELSVPGTWNSVPLVSNSNVHILYYLSDAEGGPIPLSEELREAISSVVYQEQADVRREARLEELSAAAVVTYPET